jgi:ribulose-5-phosphate 4-epimerase/fuculose-1-phosphate aldolase
LLANHGVLVVGSSIEQAYLRAATLEWRSRVAFEVESLGGGNPLPDKVASTVGSMIDGNGFPFYWEASARRVLRQHPDLFG